MDGKCRRKQHDTHTVEERRERREKLEKRGDEMITRWSINLPFIFLILLTLFSLCAFSLDFFLIILVVFLLQVYSTLLYSTLWWVISWVALSFYSPSLPFYKNTTLIKEERAFNFSIRDHIFIRCFYLLRWEQLL